MPTKIQNIFLAIKIKKWKTYFHEWFEILPTQILYFYMPLVTISSKTAHVNGLPTGNLFLLAILKEPSVKIDLDGWSRTPQHKSSISTGTWLQTVQKTYV